MKNILNRGFAKLPLNAFVAKVKVIIARLTDNPFFPTTDPTLARVQLELNVLAAALILSTPQERKAAVPAARSKLQQTLDDLADDLEATAQMDPVKLATTGFDLRRTTQQSWEAPGVPQELRLRYTSVSGQVKVLLRAVLRAKGYEVQTATDPTNGPWTTYGTFSSVRGIILEGFPRAQDLWVRIRALGSRNTKGGWSYPGTILVN
ncbi:MAG TPA: hypothetical protein VGL24_02875 [Chthoniobacterales bacterium]|jgi:hypothetical protein